MDEGRRIRRARELAGLTQAELGTKVGVTMRTIGNWERGATVPRNRRAVLEEVLGLDAKSEDFSRMRIRSDEDDRIPIKAFLKAMEWAMDQLPDADDPAQQERTKKRLSRMNRLSEDTMVPASLLMDELLRVADRREHNDEGDLDDEAQESRTETSRAEHRGARDGEERPPSIAQPTMTERVAAIEGEIRSLPGADAEALITQLRATAAKEDRDHIAEGRGDLPKTGGRST